MIKETCRHPFTIGISPDITKPAHLVCIDCGYQPTETMQAEWDEMMECHEAACKKGAAASTKAGHPRKESSQ